VIVSINQPSYLPWLGYWDRIRQSDKHIVLDHVQLEKGGYTNRTRIQQSDGRLLWLTVPVEKGQPINTTKIVSLQDRWRWKHRRAITQAYGAGIVEIYAYPTLIEVLDDTTDQLAPRFGCDPAEWVLSSDLGGEKLGVKSELVLNLCKEVGADVYLSGPHGRDYLDLPAFEDAGIGVEYHDYPLTNPVLSCIHHLAVAV